MEEKKLYAELTYEEVVRKYADMVTKVCLIRCGNIEDARDCFQEVFMKLFESEKIFTSQEHLKAWLIRVAMNQSFDIVKQFWRSKITFCGNVMAEDLSVVSVTDSQDSKTLQYVLSLPVKYRKVLYMYYYEEYEVAEVAEILGLKESTVKSQLRRGRELLKKKFGGVTVERAI